MRTREEYLRAADEWLMMGSDAAKRFPDGQLSQAYFQGALAAVALAEAVYLPEAGPTGPQSPFSLIDKYGPGLRKRS